MSWQQPELLSPNHTDSSAYDYSGSIQKPVEVYFFFDPFSEDCWSLQAYLKKLMLEYGRFFTVRAVVSGRFSIVTKQALNAHLNGQPSIMDETTESFPVTHPMITSLAIKASELQGKRAGNLFLRKVQEKRFVHQSNISDLNVLLTCAKEANLDMHEFERDLTSRSAKRAYQCDLRLSNEMDVDTLPTMVFFNQSVEEHGIKVSGLYPYEIYELVLSEILAYHPIPSSKPPLEELVKKSSMIGTKEVAIIYNWSEAKALKEMKKLKLQQQVEMVKLQDAIYWKPKK